MGRDSFDAIKFDLGLFFYVQIRIVNLKSTYNLLIIGPRAFGC